MNKKDILGNSMSLLIIIIISFASLRLCVIVLNYFSGLHLRDGAPDSQFLVSILIPARNEGHHISTLLRGLSAQTYQHFEVLVYDDDSTDDTAPVVSSFCANDKRFRLISGIPLPMGWLGKPHACHRLASEARGDYFIFMDADVSVSPSLLGKAVAYALGNDLSLMSVFPQQQMWGPGERIMVPLMNWILLSLLPMILIRKTRNPSLAAANGQFMMFRAEDYRVMSWHERFKTEAVEDIKISRALKKAGFRMATLLGNEDVYCRMYSSYGEALHGFTKNSLQFFGGSRLAMLLFAGLVLPGGLIVLLYGEYADIILYCIVIVFMRVFISFASRQSILWNILLAPLQLISFGVLTLRAIYFSFFGRYVWKGRDIGTVE